MIEVPGAEGSNERLEAVDDAMNPEIRKDGGRK